MRRKRTPLAVYLAALTLTVAMNDTRRIEQTTGSKIRRIKEAVK